MEDEMPSDRIIEYMRYSRFSFIKLTLTQVRETRVSR